VWISTWQIFIVVTKSKTKDIAKLGILHWRINSFQHGNETHQG
jgi:hypothetical protein